jgi:exonuclease III
LLNNNASIHSFIAGEKEKFHDLQHLLNQDNVNLNVGLDIIRNASAQLHSLPAYHHGNTHPSNTKEQTMKFNTNLIDIAHHNINGIKRDKDAFLRLNEALIDTTILTINETNLNERDGKFLEQSMALTKKFFWSRSNLDKRKGYGVAIGIDTKWEKYVGKVTRCGGYALSITLYMKQCKITITTIYKEPNNPEAADKIIEYLNKEVFKGYRVEGNHYHIITGDLNSTINEALDRQISSRSQKQNTRKTKAGNSKDTQAHIKTKHNCGSNGSRKILHWLKDKGFLDTFRECHPTSRAYTWRREDSTSRIDYIWVSNNWHNLLLSADIKDQLLITDSDHKIITCTLNTSDIIKNQSQAQETKMNYNRRIFQYDMATSKHYERFEQGINFMLNDDETKINKVYNNSNIPDQTKVNTLWGMYSTIIKVAAEAHIPNKVVSTKLEGTRQKTPTVPRHFYKDLRLIRILIKICRENLGLPPDHNTKQKFDNVCANINIQYELQSDKLPSIPELWNSEFMTKAIKAGTCIKDMMKKVRLEKEVTQIMEFVDKRASIIQENQSTMLNSLLNRTKDRIVIDRLMIKPEGSNKEILITDEKQILKECRTQFVELTKTRRHGFDNITPTWKKAYEPITTISSSIYGDLMSAPTLAEWQQLLNGTSNDSAPGASNIGYAMLKKCGVRMTQELLKFGELIFTSGCIPITWKHSSIFPIPKPKEWRYNLGNTRPIILLECLRKMYVRILNQRLGAICLEHNIL